MLWLYYTIITAFLLAAGNVLEKTFVIKYIKPKDTYAYMVLVLLFSSLIAMFFFPFANLKDLTLTAYALISFRTLFYLAIFYFWVRLMLKEEVSRVVGILFTYIVVTFILDYFIFGTKLQFLGYLGGILLLASGILMTYKPSKKLFVDKDIIAYVLISILLWSLYRISLKGVSLYTYSFTYLTVDYFNRFIVGLIVFVFSTKLRDQTKQLLNIPKPFLRTLLIMMLFYAAAIYTSYKAYSLQRVSVLVPFETLQPTFVFLIALFLSHYHSKHLKEEIDKKTISYKVAALVLLTIGVYLMLRYTK